MRRRSASQSVEQPPLYRRRGSRSSSTGSRRSSTTASAGLSRSIRVAAPGTAVASARRPSDSSPTRHSETPPSRPSRCACTIAPRGSASSCCRDRLVCAGNPRRRYDGQLLPVGDEPVVHLAADDAPAEGARPCQVCDQLGEPLLRRGCGRPATHASPRRNAGSCPCGRRPPSAGGAPARRSTGCSSRAWRIRHESTSVRISLRSSNSPSMQASASATGTRMPFTANKSNSRALTTPRRGHGSPGSAAAESESVRPSA